MNGGQPAALVITALRGTLHHHPYPQAVLDLIGECVRPDPTARPTAADVLARLHAAPAAL